MKTTANVYLLNTNDNLSYPFIAKNMELGSDNNLCVVMGNSSNSLDLQPQHLYITLPQSDLEISKIKEGDWYLDTSMRTSNYGIHRCDSKRLEAITKQFFNVAEKIIATTDENLSYIKHETYPNSNTKGIRSLIELPSIPKSFIEYYISKHNEGIKVSKVEVELMSAILRSYGGGFIPSRLKLTLNNEISIVIPECNCMEIICDKCEAKIDNSILEEAKKPVEKMYTREEVERLCKDAYVTGSKYTEFLEAGMVVGTIRYWIKKNLK